MPKNSVLTSDKKKKEVAANIENELKKAKIRIAELQAENTQLKRRMAPMAMKTPTTGKQGDTSKAEDSSMCNVEPLKMTLPKKQPVTKKKNITQSDSNTKKSSNVKELVILNVGVNKQGFSFNNKPQTSPANSAKNIPINNATDRKLAFKKQIEIIKKRIDDNVQRTAKKRADPLVQEKKFQRNVDKIGNTMEKHKKNIDNDREPLVGIQHIVY